MSYQNPLTLTPKLYQSTDPQAPQLLGQLGDFKSVFKACLVTGYGEKQGAGYTMENETDVSCEFVSPNIMMSKIGISETSSNAEYYYLFGTTKRNVSQINHYKSYIGKNTSWTMLVCELGVYFIVTLPRGVSQIAYQGLIKSAINDNNINMIQFNLGNLANSSASYAPMYNAINIGTFNNADILSNAYALANNSKDGYVINLISDVFWRKNGTLLGKQPAILLKNGLNLPAKTAISDYQGRPVLSIFVGNGQSESSIKNHAFGAMIYLDEWEY